MHVIRFRCCGFGNGLPLMVGGVLVSFLGGNVKVDESERFEGAADPYGVLGKNGENMSARKLRWTKSEGVKETIFFMHAIFSNYLNIGDRWPCIRNNGDPR